MLPMGCFDVTKYDDDLRSPKDGLGFKLVVVMHDFLSNKNLLKRKSKTSRFRV